MNAELDQAIDTVQSSLGLLIDCLRDNKDEELEPLARQALLSFGIVMHVISSCRPDMADSMIVDSIRKADEGSGEFALSDLQASAVIGRIRESIRLEYEEAWDDHNRLVRDLDVALNGNGAAEQASLCDIVAQVKNSGFLLVRKVELGNSWIRHRCPECGYEKIVEIPKAEPSENAEALLSKMFATIREIGYHPNRLTLPPETHDACVALIDAYASRHEQGSRADERRRIGRELSEGSVERIIDGKRRMVLEIEMTDLSAILQGTDFAKVSEDVERPRVVCLCGSTRFIELFATLAWTLERDLGVIVLGLHLLPSSYDGPDAAPDHMAEAAGKKEHFDELHKRKIDLSDEILVLNVGGYIGESTRSEIAYAEAHGKPVKYLEDSLVSRLKEGNRG